MDFISKTYTTQEIDDLVSDLRVAKDLKDEAAEKLKEASEVYEYLQGKILEAMQEVGKTSWKLKGVGNISVSERLFPKMNKDPESVAQFMDWLKSKGEDFYLSHVSVHSQTLARIVKDEVEEKGEVNIPGVDSSFRKKILSMRKG